MARIVYDQGIHRLLRERYPAPEFAVFFEVANGTGRNHSRYADAIAMSLFPSRGLDFHGFEIKEDRRDWLREMKNPEKADEVASYCDYWWLVIGSDEVAKVEEVPRTWGLLSLDGKKLVQRKKAERLKAKALDRNFVAGLLRRAHEMAEREKRRSDDKFSKVKAVEEALCRGLKEGKERAEDDYKIAQREHESLKRNVAEFERASGLEIDMWNGGRLGEAVETLRWLKQTTPVATLDSAADQLEKAASDLRQKSKALQEAPTSIPPRNPESGEPSNGLKAGNLSS